MGIVLIFAVYSMELVYALHFQVTFLEITWKYEGRKGLWISESNERKGEVLKGVGFSIEILFITN